MLEKIQQGTEFKLELGSTGSTQNFIKTIK